MFVKPGHKTTEFIVTVLFDIGILAFAIADKLPARYAALATSIGTAAYALSRGLAKRPAVVTTNAAPPGP